MPQNRQYKPGHVIKASIAYTLDNLSRMDLPTFISRMSPLPILGVLDGICNFPTHFKWTFCKQTKKILIRHRVMRCLIGIFTVCLCPIKDARLIWVTLFNIWLILESEKQQKNPLYAFTAEQGWISANIGKCYLKLSDRNFKWHWLQIIYFESGY